MSFYTGDTHGKILEIENAMRNGILTADDTIVILGDAGFNYYGADSGDKRTKYKLNKLGVTVFCIHGNHEMHPETIPTYITKKWNGEFLCEASANGVVFTDFDGTPSINSNRVSVEMLQS